MFNDLLARDLSGTFVKGLGYVLMEESGDDLLPYDIITKVFYCKQKASCIEKYRKEDIIEALKNYYSVDMIELIRGDNIIRIYPSDKARSITELPNKYGSMYINSYNRRIVSKYIEKSYTCKADESLTLKSEFLEYGIVFNAYKGSSKDQIEILNPVSCSETQCKLINKGKIIALWIFYPDGSFYIKHLKRNIEEIEMTILEIEFFNCGVWH